MFVTVRDMGGQQPGIQDCNREFILRLVSLANLFGGK